MDKDISKNDTLTSLEELFSLSSVTDKQVALSFTAPDLSSQGGLVLLREYEQQQGFIRSICSHIDIQDALIWYDVNMKRCLLSVFSKLLPVEECQKIYNVKLLSHINRQ